MIGLKFDRPISHVVCLGAHADDIEIGALGLVKSLADRYPEATFAFIVLTGDEERRTEAEASMKSIVGDAGRLHMGGFNDGLLPYEQPAAAKEFLRSAVGSSSPQLVICPTEADRHQDHAFVARLANQVFRSQLVLQYEIAKYDADLGRPQAFHEMTSDQVEAKVKHLVSHFESQRSKDWYDEEAFSALMRIRGIECGAQEGFAEAFYAPKMRLVVGGSS